MSRRSPVLLCAALLTLTALVACSNDATVPLPEPAPTVPTATGTPAPTPTETGRPAPTPTATGTPGPTPTAPATPRLAGTVATGLRSPWGLAFLPDGSALVSERDTDRIRRIAADGRVSTVGEVPGVDGRGEGGLLGIAVAPTFARDRWLYVYFTAGAENRIVRMRYDGQRLGPPQPVLDGIPAAGNHDGGRLLFGPDGMLYVGTGDAGERSRAQDRDDLGGKILRITPEGDAPAGNPFPGSPVWSYGHRNVQGLAFDDRGRLWASEFGQNTWDELNLIVAGRNYGWPEVEGSSGGTGRFVDPVTQWRTDDASPSGIAVAAGAVYVAGLRGTRLWQVPLAGGEPRAFFSGDASLGRLRTVAVAPDGSLWLMTSNTDGRGRPREGDDRIVRLSLS